MSGFKSLPKDLISTVSQVMKEGETEYQKFFQKALKKYGVTSQTQLTGTDEKKFYEQEKLIIEIFWTL